MLFSDLIQQKQYFGYLNDLIFTAEFSGVEPVKNNITEIKGAICGIPDIPVDNDDNGGGNYAANKYLQQVNLPEVDFKETKDWKATKGRAYSETKAQNLTVHAYSMLDGDKLQEVAIFTQEKSCPFSYDTVRRDIHMQGTGNTSWKVHASMLKDQTKTDGSGEWNNETRVIS